MSKTNFHTWEKEFNGQALIILEVDEKILHEACDVLFDRIVNRTPVGNPSLWHPPYWPKGYTPGNLKAAWRIEHNKNHVTIYNNEPYAFRVETGWSTQAPEGMMRVSIKEFASIIDKVKSKYKL